MSRTPPYAIKWAFTYFPNEGEDIKIFGNAIAIKEDIDYIIIGEEYAPSTGKRHFQGYMELHRKLRSNQIKSDILPNSTHIEVAKGTKRDNIIYVGKPNEKGFPEKVLFEYEKTNNRFTERKKEKLDKKDCMRSYLEDLRTKPLSYIEEEYPIQYYREFNLIQRYRLDKQQASEVWNGDLSNKNYWIWGKTGTGKSSWCRKQLSNGQRRNINIYNKQQNKWWDGYIDQKIVLIEDWNAGENGSMSKALLHYLKIWADRYTFNAEVKNATRCIFPGNYFLLITSNHSIEEVFQGCDNEDINAVKRRFTEIEIQSLQDIFLSKELDPKILSEDSQNWSNENE